MRKRYIYLLSLIITLTLSGCAANPLESKMFTIVTSFYPMYIQTYEVAGDIQGVQLVNLTPPQTGCIHDYMLSAQDLKTIENADILVLNGAGMETFIDDDLLEGKIVINASEHLDPLERANAHTWVSLDKSSKQIDAITRGLQAADPAHSQQYQQRCDQAIQMRNELSTEIAEYAKGWKDKHVVIFHDSLEFWADEWDLFIQEIYLWDEESPPSAKVLRETIEALKRDPVDMLLCAKGFQAETMKTISRETNIPYCELDILMVETGHKPADAYRVVMLDNARMLKEALP